MTRDEAEQFRPTIMVTQDCINHAIRNNPNWCMAKLGIVYTLRFALHITIDKECIRFDYQGWRFWFKPPLKEYRLIELFDDKGKSNIRPHKFKLTELIKVKPIRNRGPNSATRGDKSTRKKRKQSKPDRSYRISGVLQ